MAGFEESDLYAAFGLDRPAGENDPAPAEPGQAAQTGTNREPPNRERRKDRHRAQSPERAKPRSRRRPRSRTPPGIREMVELRAAPAVPGTFPERPRQRAGRKESPPSRPRSSGRRMQPAGGGKSSRPP